MLEMALTFIRCRSQLFEHLYLYSASFIYFQVSASTDCSLTTNSESLQNYRYIDLTSVTSAVHFRDIGCQNVTCIKAKDLVIAFGEREQTSAYRSYRYNLTGQNEVTAITDESHMPWDLPPSGNLSDFNRVILANQSVYLRFVGAFFDRSFKTLYFLHNVSNDSSKSELTYRKLGRDGNFNKSVEIQKTNSFERVDMVAALPGDPWDQVYAITHNRIGPIVNELSVWNAGRAGLGYQMVCLTLTSDSQVLLNHW